MGDNTAHQLGPEAVAARRLVHYYIFDFPLARDYVGAEESDDITLRFGHQKARFPVLYPRLVLFGAPMGGRWCGLFDGENRGNIVRYGDTN
jgi:hypothetical protein